MNLVLELLYGALRERRYGTRFTKMSSVPIEGASETLVSFAFSMPLSGGSAVR